MSFQQKYLLSAANQRKKRSQLVEDDGSRSAAFLEPCSLLHRIKIKTKQRDESWEIFEFLGNFWCEKWPKHKNIILAKHITYPKLLFKNITLILKVITEDFCQKWINFSRLTRLVTNTGDVFGQLFGSLSVESGHTWRTKREKNWNLEPKSKIWNRKSEDSGKMRRPKLSLTTMSTKIRKMLPAAMNRHRPFAGDLYYRGRRSRKFKVGKKFALGWM